MNKLLQFNPAKPADWQYLDLCRAISNCFNTEDMETVRARMEEAENSYKHWEVYSEKLRQQWHRRYTAIRNNTCDSVHHFVKIFA